MRAYIKREERLFRHPADMTKILAYLRAHGELRVCETTVERMYCEFSEQRFSAGWVNTSNENLEDFTDRLNEVNL